MRREHGGYRGFEPRLQEPKEPSSYALVPR